MLLSSLDGNKCVKEMNLTFTYVTSTGIYPVHVIHVQYNIFWGVIRMGTLK